MSKPECVESVENHDAVGPKDSTSPLSVAKHSPDLTNRIDHKSLSSKTILKDAISVVVPPVQQRWEYRVYPEELYVDNILEEYDDQDENQFLVKFSDGSEKTVSYASYVARKVNNLFDLTVISTKTIILLIRYKFDASTLT